MKILLGNNTLSFLGGSETWTYTLAIQLKKMGHDVACYSPELGIISQELEKKGIPCFKDLHTSKIRPFSYVLEPIVNHNYDVVIANHHHIVKYIRDRMPAKPIISVIHGVIHFVDDGQGNTVMAPEHPALDSGVNQFVSVSEEIQQKIQKDYGIDSIVIRNAFDLERLKTVRTISPGVPKMFFVNTNYHAKDDPEINVIREVARHYGAKLSAVGLGFTPTFDIKRALEDADIVVARGRSVLEGVAAGRLGIVHGMWGTGGVICESNLEELRAVNFSGRNATGMWTKEQFIEQIDKYYNEHTIAWGLEYIAKNHNIAAMAESFLAIARDLTGRTYSKPESGNAGMKKIKFAS